MHTRRPLVHHVPLRAMLLITWLWLLLARIVGALEAEEAVCADTTAAGPARVFIVGNSFAVDIELILPKVVSHRLGHQPTVNSRTPGGATLGYHADMYPTAAPFDGGCTYEAVVLQEQSILGALQDNSPVSHALGAQYTRGYSLETLRTFYAPGAKRCGTPVVVLQTWALQDSTGTAYPVKGPGWHWHTFADFTTALVRGAQRYYEVLAAAGVAATVAPAGQAFQRVHADDRHLFNKLYARDGKHQSRVGAFLVAQTLFETLYGKSGLTWKPLGRGSWWPPGITLLEAQYLACVACEVVHCHGGGDCSACGSCCVEEL